MLKPGTERADMNKIFVPHFLRIHAKSISASSFYSSGSWAYQNAIPVEHTKKLEEKFGFRPGDTKEYFASSSGDYATSLKCDKISDINPKMVERARNKAGENTRVFRANAAYLPSLRNGPDHLVSFEPFDLVGGALTVILLRGIAGCKKSITIAYRRHNEKTAHAIQLVREFAEKYGAKVGEKSVRIWSLGSPADSFAKQTPHIIVKIRPTKESREIAELDARVIECINSIALTPPATKAPRMRIIEKAGKLFENIENDIALTGGKFVLLEERRNSASESRKKLGRLLPKRAKVNMKQLAEELAKKGINADERKIASSLERINGITGGLFEPELRAEIEIEQ